MIHRRDRARQLLVGALDRTFEVLASVPLVLEYEAVLTRPEHLEASGLTAPQVNEVLDALVKVSIPVPLRFLWRPRLKDPADEMVLETAVNGAADLLAYVAWPQYDPALLVETVLELPVQVNGKLRDVIRVAANATQAEVEQAALAEAQVHTIRLRLLKIGACSCR